MAITAPQLVEIYDCTFERANRFCQFLNEAMGRFDINSPERQAAFLAQVGHESGRLRYVEELASGRAYEGRADLGNSEPGDGVRYKGRGLIQITGRGNYAKASEALDVDFIGEPELLERPGYACLSAAWFWATHGLNELADTGDFRKITRRINGGFNGLADRLALWDDAKRVLNASYAGG